MATHPKRAVPGGPRPGRPTLYTVQLAEAICGLVAQGNTVGEAAKEVGVSLSAINNWRSNNITFREALTHARTRAREEQARRQARDRVEYIRALLRDGAVTAGPQGPSEGSKAPDYPPEPKAPVQPPDRQVYTAMPPRPVRQPPRALPWTAPEPEQGQADEALALDDPLRGWD